VPATGLQAALDAAQPGDTIELSPDTVYTGNFVLPRKTVIGIAPITLRTLGTLPAGRVSPATPGLATVRSPNALPALRTAPGASRYRIEGIRFSAGSSGDVVQLGDGLNADPALTPTDLVLDRVVIIGEPTSKRGVQLNSAATTIRSSHIGNIRLSGQESQGIAGWNGPGPFTIEDNYIEAGSIGVLFGGAQPAIANLVPSDITFRRNLVSRPVAWRGLGMCKNIFELKNARRVTARGNVFENNWSEAQSGWGIVLTVRAHGTTASWSTIEDVDFSSNIVRHSASGINILGRDDTYPSQVARRISIRGNLFYDIDHVAWGGNGAWMLVGGGPEQLHVESNTVMHTGNVLSVNGPTSPGFRLVGNIAKHNAYGLFGNNVGTGNAAIAQYFPGATVTGNVLAGGNANLYPAGNLFPTVAVLMAQFADAAAGNYRLVEGSPYETLGMDQDVIEAAMVAAPVVRGARGVRVRP
jgi:hypothetical protein